AASDAVAASPPATRRIYAREPPFWKNWYTESGRSWLLSRSPNASRNWNQLLTNVGYPGRPRPTVPAKQAVDVLAASMGLAPLGFSSTKTPGCRYSATCPLPPPPATRTPVALCILISMVIARWQGVFCALLFRPTSFASPSRV